MRRYSPLLLVIVGCGIGSESPPPSQGISFPISCTASTQERFDEGVFRLHNMMYDQARLAFEEAATRDPECAMLHWGVAMSHFNPRWPGEPTHAVLRAGAAAVERARTLDASERESGWIDAAAAYYRDWPERDRIARRRSWQQAQGVLAVAYPEDVEAQVFLALAQLTTTDPADRTFARDFEIAQRLERIREERPEHPGVLHYLIHAYDNPIYASWCGPVAQAYREVAPEAPHALHMPSHTYVRLGDWEQVVFWNIRSRHAAESQSAEGGVSRHFLHALDYLVYGYLQTGDDEQAQDEAARTRAPTEWQLDSGPAAYALAAAPARVAIERSDWGAAATLEPRAVPYSWERYPWAEAVTHAARGLGAARGGAPGVARDALAALERLEVATQSSWWQVRIRIQREVIEGWLAHVGGESDEAVEILRRAADAELAAGKQAVEPGHVVYAVEQLGDLLLALDRPAEALVTFERALAETPLRYHSLAGAGRAAEHAGLPEKASRHYATLVGQLGSPSRSDALHAVAYLDRSGP